MKWYSVTHYLKLLLLSVHNWHDGHVANIEAGGPLHLEVFVHNRLVVKKLQALQLNVHFTIQAIDDAGGWKADTLTEDIDLSYRAQLKNWQIVYLENVEAPAELPVEMNVIRTHPAKDE